MQGTAPVMSTGIRCLDISCSPLTRCTKASFCYWSLSSRAQSLSLPTAAQQPSPLSLAHSRSCSSWIHLNSQTKAPHTDKGSTDQACLTYSLTSNEYIHTCANKLFRELLETGFQVPMFQVSFQILTSAKCIPSCLRFKRSLSHSHSPVHRLTVGKTAQLRRGFGWCRALPTGAFQKESSICKITLSYRKKKAKPNKTPLW